MFEAEMVHYSVHISLFHILSNFNTSKKRERQLKTLFYQTEQRDRSAERCRNDTWLLVWIHTQRLTNKTCSSTSLNIQLRLASASLCGAARCSQDSLIHLSCHQILELLGSTQLLAAASTLLMSVRRCSGPLVWKDLSEETSIKFSSVIKSERFITWKWRLENVHKSP